MFTIVHHISVVTQCIVYNVNMYIYTYTYTCAIILLCGVHIICHVLYNITYNIYIYIYSTIGSMVYIIHNI